MNMIKCGWLSPSGQFIECNSYEHMAIAQELVDDEVLYYLADDYLIKNGWVKIYRNSFLDHKWHIDWDGFLSEQQKYFLRPVFENVNNDILAYCIDCWEDECSG